MASRNILEVTGFLGSFTNPSFSHSANKTWSGDLFNGQTFLKNDPPAWEWTPLFDQHDEFDTKIVGVSGTAVFSASGPISSTDNPFLHPFGFDFEFFIAPDSQYASLLAPNNLSPDDPLVGDKQDSEYHAAIIKANDPNGLNLNAPGVLGVETDQDLVPSQYRAQDGDRVAVFGRWIVDTGHEDFHTEIHPPLLLACARSISQVATHSTVVGRPYLVSQDFGDGGLRQHLINQIAQIPTGIPGIPGNLRVEAHPQIKTTPFSGIQIMSYLVRPLSPRQNPEDVLQVRYHFTVRSGVVVQVINDTTEDAIKVVIEMNDAVYKPASLPPRHDWDISLNDLDKLKPGLGTMIKEVLVVVALGFPLTGFPDPILGALVSGILAQGIRTDRYDAPQAVSAHDAEITTITADKLGAGPHFSVDDEQSFPVYGFLDVQWGPPKTKTEGKEGKEKEKEKEASKDHKDNKDNAKEKESHKEVKDGAKEIEQNLAPGGSGMGSSASMLFPLGTGTEVAEPPLATGQAFIRAEERPDVGGRISQQPTQE